MKFLRESFKGKNVARFDAAQNLWVIKIPKRFSFISNPEETLAIINSIVEISRKPRGGVYIDHSDLEEMDLGASTVFDVMVFNMRSEWIATGEKCSLGGEMPRDDYMCNIVQCMGLTKHLKVEGMEPPPELEQSFVQFPLFAGRKRKGIITDQERAATNLALHVDKCLQVAGECMLSNEGKSCIVKWVGEVIGNCEDHSGQNDWYAMGYMAPVVVKKASEADNEDVIGECQLTVFCFGKSIYESLSDPNTPPDTREQVNDLVNKHTSFFAPWKKYSKEDLWTLYALQDGVSRFSQRPGESSRGKGTIQMIEAFHHLGQTVDPTKRTEMSLISGHTRIYFSNKYHLQPKAMEGGGERMIIAFNEENDLDKKPDPNHVHSLDGKFPGTVLSFKFYIDKRYLKEVHGKDVRKSN